MIRNPILPGFNPDPCICRRGDDFYLAVSSFEWSTEYGRTAVESGEFYLRRPRVPRTLRRL